MAAEDFYIEMQEMALELFDEDFGFEATLFEADATSKGKVMVVSLDNKHATMMGLTVAAQSRAFLLSPETKVKPKKSDYIEFGSGANKKSYTFKETTDLTPDGTHVMYYAGVAT